MISGPKHCKWYFLDILLHPVPWVEFEGRIGNVDYYSALRRRKFNHNLLARQLAQTKCLNQKGMTQSTTSIVYDCRMSYIDPNAPRLHGYETYFTLHSESMGKQVNEGEHSKPMTLFFAISQFSFSEIVFCGLPQKPPDGIIMHAVMSTLIVGIFGIITFRASISLAKQKLVAEIHTIRWTD
jgi:hypothetical protein